MLTPTPDNCANYAKGKKAKYNERSQGESGGELYREKSMEAAGQPQFQLVCSCIFTAIVILSD